MLVNKDASDVPGVESTNTCEEYYVGVMTGTSLDGVDVVLTKITTTFDSHGEKALNHTHTSIVNSSDIESIASQTYHLPQSLTDTLSALSSIEFEAQSLASIKRAEQTYTQVIADSVNAFIQPYRSTLNIRAIGCHGLTVCHMPDGEVLDYGNSDKTQVSDESALGFSWQLLNGSLLAAQTGLDVVFDFRSKDVALGGQGAPLVPPFHRILFESTAAIPESSDCRTNFDENRIVLNMGGIANLSYWDTHYSYGFDTGPANTLIDQWISLHQGLSYDENGDWGRSGVLNKALLAHFLDDPYFRQASPKSTGKEYFNLDWLKQKLSNYSHTSKQSYGSITPVDVQATLTHLTAVTIADEIIKISESGVLVCCGGGVKNVFLMSLLSSYLPRYDVLSSDDFGINSDDIEALAFAWLAYCRVWHVKAGQGSVTNAKRNSVLGAWVSAD